MNAKDIHRGKKQVDAETQKFAPTTVVGKVKELANRDVLLASIRQTLTVLGGIMLAFNLVPDTNLDGVANSTDIDLLIGTLMVVLGVSTSLWNAIKNYRRKKLLVQTQAMAPQVVTVAARVVAASEAKELTDKAEVKAKTRADKADANVRAAQEDDDER